MAKDKDEKMYRRNIYVDIASIFFVVFFLLSFAWSAFDIVPILSLASPHLKRPMYVWLAIADIFPCIFGLFWLVRRYGDIAEKHYSFIGKKWFIVFLFLAVLSFNTIIHLTRR